MQPIQPGARGAARNRSGTAWLAPTECTLGVLEIVASEQQARTRAWIDDFLGPLPAAGAEARRADR